MSRRWFQRWRRSSNDASNKICHSRVQGDTECPHEGRIAVAETDDVQAANSFETTQKATYSTLDSNNARKANVVKKAKSWPESDCAHLQKDTPKSQKLPRGMEPALLESDGCHHGTQIGSPNQVIPTLLANTAPFNENGPPRAQQNRQEDLTKDKETKLRSLRWKVLKLRATVAEKRRELTHARLDVIHADEDFMKLAREMRMQQSDAIYEGSTLFEERYSKLQAARDKYGLLEESYGILEERLNREEYGISQLEQELDTGDDDSSKSHTDNSGISTHTTDDRESANPFANSGQYTLYDEYMSKLGDADLVNEDLLELRFARRNLQGFQESRKRVGLELSPEDQETLDNYAAEKTTLQGQLKEIKADVECLRIQCVEAGLMEDGGEDDILSISDSSIVSQHERYALLQEQPDEKQVDQSSKSLLLNFDEENPGDRVERWLLHKLRSSGSEVELLARLSTDDGVDTQVDTHKWQEQVLVFWFIDSTNLPPSAYHVPPSVYHVQGAAFPKSPFADRNNLALFNSDQAYLVELVIRSSSLFIKAELARRLQLVLPKVEMAKSVR